jgi:putative Mn2+ efflux pump MntP
LSYITIALIAIGLSMDAFAVSVSEGFALKRYRVRNALKLAVSFGVFQAVMPIAGWLAGAGFRRYVASLDHWVAFALLFAVGAKMIYESRVEREIEAKADSISIRTLFALAIATSIDAFAVGITFSFLDVSIVWPVVIIGFVTFVNSLIGYSLGGRLGAIFGSKVEIAGGLVLIAIGFKILFEHTCA